MGGSKTFIFSCETAEPPQIVLHSKDLNISDEVKPVQDKRIKIIQKILSDLKIGPPQIYYGSDWFIEPFYGYIRYSGKNPMGNNIKDEYCVK